RPARGAAWRARTGQRNRRLLSSRYEELSGRDVASPDGLHEGEEPGRRHRSLGRRRFPGHAALLMAQDRGTPQITRIPAPGPKPLRMTLGVILQFVILP